ncbi:helix-turn-helix domain-containing protein [Streptococcus parasanguinis]|uniref:helix-turn-helix domain-containing protein n=1 Tax=Streptococcus parasanguinis TaxID=1318 RepID=UPI001F4F14A0|nr:helix-turn-helix domain-containing protein [Streptococcus parasanguinis]
MAKNSPQDIENREYFSNQLNKIMKEKGIRQIDISNALNIPKSTLTGYVKGRTLPNEEKSKKIADLLGVPIYAIDKRFKPIDEVNSLIESGEERLSDSFKAIDKTISSYNLFIDSHTSLLDSIINIVEKKPRNWEDFLLKGLNSLKEGTNLLDGLVNNIINEFKLQNDELISQVELQKVKGFLDLVDYSQKK